MRLPFYIEEGEPYRPDAYLWMQVPGQLILSYLLIERDGPPVSLSESLHQAMVSPMVGPPRTPGRVRVADVTSAEALRADFPDIKVSVGPTPEFEEVLEMLGSGALQGGEAGHEPSFFERDVSADALASLFRNAEALFRVAPWRLASDDQVLGVDIPALDIDGACLSIIGTLEESLGFILFPSFEAYDNFLEFAERRPTGHGPIDMGTSIFALDFERGATLPASLRKEISQHGWPVADARAYPMIHHRDSDGIPRPLCDHDVRVMAACAGALAAFMAKNGAIFAEEYPEPLGESFFDEDLGDIEVRLAYPFEETWEVPEGRDPDEGGSRQGAGRGRPSPLHAMDERLVGALMTFARERFGGQWIQAFEVFDDPQACGLLAQPWGLFDVSMGEETVVDAYLKAHGDRLSPVERGWLDAQGDAWLSLWEVVEVDPGRGMKLKDLLTYQEREVHEVAASELLVPRSTLLGRVVDYDGVSLLAGVHPNTLPPPEAAEVEAFIRRRVRLKRAIPVERLRPNRVGRALIERWEEEVDVLIAQRSVLPRMQNTDGEDLLLTADHFVFETQDRPRIEDAIAQLEGVDSPQDEGHERVYHVSKPTEAPGPEMVLIARVLVGPKTLRVETNSVARAEDLRRRVEGACEGLLRHRARDHSDPMALAALATEQMKEGDPRSPRGPEALPTEETDSFVIQMKTQHYVAWPDHPLPALDGATPREAIRTKAGRYEVDLLLKDCEYHEGRMPAGQRFDFSILRRELGLETP
ncbi:MAG: hypothetical protein KAI47_00965 [Deltaproteobacteria bacterium]|nr:hypothetical protein [Deltaproteobacteria bacterium]